MNNLAKLHMELQRRKQEEKLRFFYADNKPVHHKQMLWHLNTKRNKWTLAGNRCGKTVAGAVETVITILGENARPYIQDWPEDIRLKYEPMITKLKDRPNAEAWVVSLTNEVQRDVAQKELLKWLPLSEYDPQNVSTRLGRKDDLENAVIDTLPLKNGRKISFKSCDQGRAKFQGTSKDIIWFDEEPPKEIYDECLMRTMDCKGTILGTMTPLMGLTFVYDDIYLNENKPLNKQDKEIFCIQWSWDDNPFLLDEEKQRLEAALDPAELEARKSGKFIMPGKCVFDRLALMEYQDKCYPGERGNLIWQDEKRKSVKWEQDPYGDYEVWFHPNNNNEYLISGDIAEGLEHGDYDAIGVLNRNELRLDAVYHGHIDADILADYIHRLAIYYYTPLVAPECNNHGLTTISHLKLVYQDIYRTMIVDKVNDEEREKLGWCTTSKTRPLLVDAIKRAIRERSITIYWRRFVDEAMAFVRDANGKEQARSGYWDDVVIMMGIGTYIHNTNPLLKDIAAPYIPGKTDAKPSFRPGKFLHPSKIEDMQKDEWDNDDDW